MRINVMENISTVGCWWCSNCFSIFFSFLFFAHPYLAVYWIHLALSFVRSVSCCNCGPLLHDVWLQSERERERKREIEKERERGGGVYTVRLVRRYLYTPECPWIRTEETPLIREGGNVFTISQMLSRSGLERAELSPPPSLLSSPLPYPPILSSPLPSPPLPYPHLWSPGGLSKMERQNGD